MPGVGAMAGVGGGFFSTGGMQTGAETVDSCVVGAVARSRLREIRAGLGISDDSV